MKTRYTKKALLLALTLILFVFYFTFTLTALQILMFAAYTGILIVYCLKITKWIFLTYGYDYTEQKIKLKRRKKK